MEFAALEKFRLRLPIRDGVEPGARSFASPSARNDVGRRSVVEGLRFGREGMGDQVSPMPEGAAGREHAR